MKKIKRHLNLLLVTATIAATCTTSLAQTSKDTVRPGHPNDGMNVDPGKANDPMAVKPAAPHDGMSVISDTGFLSKNILDNQMEIKLSKIAQEKATDPATKKVAALILKDHAALLSEMEKLAATKTGNSSRSQGNRTDPPTNFPEGKGFDAAWAGEMLTMHEAKIAEMENFLSLTKDPALKAAVMKALPKIKAHKELLLKIPGAQEKSRSSHTI